jgi:hypothetical protein
MIDVARLQFMPCIVLLVVMYVASVPAKSADCAQLNNLMNIADLKTLATGPSKQNPRNKSKSPPQRSCSEAWGASV